MQDRERQEREHEGSRHPFDRNGELCRSTAKLDRDTFTTVASICDINEPSIATEATFQMPEGSLSALVSH